MRLPGSTFQILTALAVRPLHGYAVIQEISALTDGAVRLSVGTLYGALDRLAEAGLVHMEREEVVGGRLRRYYALTEDGSRALESGIELRRREARVAAERLRARSRRTGLVTP